MSKSVKNKSIKSTWAIVQPDKKMITISASEDGDSLDHNCSIIPISSTKDLLRAIQSHNITTLKINMESSKEELPFCSLFDALNICRKDIKNFILSSSEGFDSLDRKHIEDLFATDNINMCNIEYCREDFVDIVGEN